MFRQPSHRLVKIFLDRQLIIEYSLELVRVFYIHYKGLRRTRFVYFRSESETIINHDDRIRSKSRFADLLSIFVIALISTVFTKDFNNIHLVHHTDGESLSPLSRISANVHFVSSKCVHPFLRNCSFAKRVQLSLD